MATVPFSREWYNMPVNFEVGKVVRKGGKKTVDRLLELIRGNPKITFAEMVSAAGISRSAIQKHIERLKDAQRLRRVGPDKGGHWEVIEKA